MKKNKLVISKYKKNNHILYGVCAIGMVALIVTALFLPQLVFAMQDRYRMTNTEVQARNSLDISQLDTGYEQDLNARLKYFFDMKSNLVTAIYYDLTNDTEVTKVLESVFEDEWFYPILEIYGMTMNNEMMVDYNEKISYDISECKKYLVHGADYRDGVALMMWYLDISIEALDTRVRLLMDSESDTVYYIKISTKENNSTYKISNSGKLYYFLEIMSFYYDFYHNYYDADIGISDIEYEENHVDPGYIQQKLQENKCSITYYFPYGELTGEFLLQIEYGEDSNCELTIGFPIIGERIPEMIQD